MQASVKPNASDDRRDFVVIPSDQVRVAPSDAEITDLLRAAARQHSEAGVRAAGDPDTTASAPVPTVDTTFRATVSDARGPTLGRRLMRAVAALLVAAGITGAALGWQVFGYTAKKAFGRWLPQLALTSSLTMDKFGFGSESKPADKPADATADAAQPAAPAQTAADSTTPDSSAPPATTAAAATAAPSPDPTQQLQSMAHDLANANQEIETLKASIAELKASQQQMAHELAKTSEKLAEQGAKAKVAAVPRPAAHRPASSYSPTSTYSPSPTPVPSPSYRPAPSSYSVQAAVPPPPATAQPNVPPPIPLQPEPGSASVPRPPMPVQ